jgi:hypothetical protein
VCRSSSLAVVRNALRRNYEVRECVKEVITVRSKYMPLFCYKADVKTARRKRSASV